MSTTSQTSAEILRAPLTPVAGLIPAALKGGTLASAAIVGLIAALVLIVRTSQGRELDLGHLALWSACSGAMLAVLLSGFRLFQISRLFADKSFTVLGVIATFFGLAMLAVFFAQLGFEAYEWFTITPQLVQKRNRVLEDRVANSAANIDKALANMDEEMEREMALVATDAEKQAIRDIFVQEEKPAKLKALLKNLEEDKIIRAAGVRADTSPVGLFTYFVSNGPSDQPQDIGVYPALMGSLLISLMTIVFAVPLGVGAALYLEEYKSNNLLGRIIQININNLAGIPSVVYGILGGLVFVELIFKPLELRLGGISARNVFGGGMTLALLTLPVVIVSAQEAIRAVPTSIRQGAYALGATHWQVIWRQVLPLAWPGILTGTILALSRAIGEAAPLVLFGAAQYVDSAPRLFDKFTVLPMQIFSWADRPSGILEGHTIQIWRANAAMGCIVLLIALLGLNAIAIVMRNRAQRRMKW